MWARQDVPRRVRSLEFKVVTILTIRLSQTRQAHESFSLELGDAAIKSTTEVESLISVPAHMKTSYVPGSASPLENTSQEILPQYRTLAINTNQWTRAAALQEDHKS